MVEYGRNRQKGWVPILSNSLIQFRASEIKRRGTPTLSTKWKKKQKEREEMTDLKSRVEGLRREKEAEGEKKREEKVERERRRLRNQLKATSYQQVNINQGYDNDMSYLVDIQA